MEKEIRNISLRDVLCNPKTAFHKEYMLNRLKESGRSNYIFGGASQAINVARMLTENAIEIEGFFESKHYYKEGRYLLDKPVYLYDEETRVSEKRNIILGASGKNISSVVSKEKEFGNEIFVFDTTTPLFDMTYEWVCSHLDELEKTLSLLEDDLSRETFLSFIDNKAHCISGNIRPLWELWVSDQYFNDLYVFDRYPIHAMVDCGAWIGDTAEQYLKFVHDAGIDGYVYAFEPEPDNYLKLQETAKRIKNIECFNYAVGSEETQVTFCSGNSSTSHLSDNDEGIKVNMIPADKVLEGKRVSLVKMDLEGNEESALIGMKNTIRANKPMLAICVYHKVDDLIRIPNCIASLVEGTGINYRYYLRHHAPTRYETVMYAVPD